MPVVPTYNGPQVQEQATRGGYQDTPDVSQGARSIAQGLGVVADAADRIVQRDVETQANTADTEISAGWLKWDAQNRRNYQGEKAGEYTAAAEKWWADTAKGYAEKLDPFAKRAVTQTLLRRQAASLGQVTQFVETEKEKHADQTAAANIDTTIQFGVSSGDVVGASDRVRTLSAQVGARKGWTTEQVQAETLKNLSALHIAQIAKLTELPGGAEAASAYYQANKAEIGFAQQPKVEQVIKAEVDNQFATQTAAEVAALPLSEQLATAAKITDPARREKTIAQIKSNHVLVREAQIEQERKFADTAWQLVGQGKKVPEAILASMDGRERVQLQEHLRAKAERGSAPVKTDMATYIKAREALVSPDPAVRASVNLLALTEKIGAGHMEQLLDIKTATSKPGGSGKQDSIVTDAQRLDSGLLKAGIDKKRDPDGAGKFMDEVDRRVRALSHANGDKPVSPDDKQRIIDDVSLDKVFREEWGNDPEIRATDATSADFDKAYVKVKGEKFPLRTLNAKTGKLEDSIPIEDFATIRKGLQQRGLPSTTKDVAEVYLEKNPAKKKAVEAPFDALASARAGNKPSPYAPTEAWAAYREWQAANKKAPQ